MLQILGTNSSRVKCRLIEEMSQVDVLTPRDESLRQVPHAVEDEVELLDGAGRAVFPVHRCPGQRALAQMTVNTRSGCRAAMIQAIMMPMSLLT